MCDVLMSVKQVLLLVLAVVFLTGCKTSTVESRKQERSVAYSMLSQAIRADVDAGRIRAGMNGDAVYMSWGKPAQVLESGNEQGLVTTWLYEGGWMQEERYWSYRAVGTGRDAWAERYIVRDYHPRAYISAEVTFVDSVVKQWRTLPRPTY